MLKEAKENGEDPTKVTKVDVWIKGYKSKANKPLCEAVHNILNEIDELHILECPSNDNSFKEDSLTKVLGPERCGRVRGLGFGATSSQTRFIYFFNLEDQFVQDDDLEDQVVAEWGISSTDPMDRVHHMLLGRSYWRVWVDVVINDIKVCRPTNDYETLEGAIGSSVAWLKDCIKL
ncbi:hypothetical protein EZV62_012415 [Acer yangbiense]|uniref:DUF8039 domain-containing protein n=1 Tax=Acer yangbiense TaxID=1000413 RepID=A0A5C7HY22_9ROSI|nr:hypothetical protein EZV62_012415 [Acer yangbiense]